MNIKNLIAELRRLPSDMEVTIWSETHQTHLSPHDLLITEKNELFLCPFAYNTDVECEDMFDWLRGDDDEQE